MAYANGQIPTTRLRTVAKDVQLIGPAANAYKTLVLLGWVIGETIEPAKPHYGSGYRNHATQVVFWEASRGDDAALKRTGLNPDSIIRVANPGYSSHGTGDRIDLLFNDSAHPNAVQLAIANHCGWGREFRANDPNHFMHDGHTAISGPSDSDWNRIIARYLNGRQLGRETATVKDGQVDRQHAQNFTWLVQAAGMHDGIYDSPPLKHDGIWGPHTDGVYEHYKRQLWNS